MESVFSNFCEESVGKLLEDLDDAPDPATVCPDVTNDTISKLVTMFLKRVEECTAEDEYETSILSYFVRVLELLVVFFNMTPRFRHLVARHEGFLSACFKMLQLTNEGFEDFTADEQKIARETSFRCVCAMMEVFNSGTADVVAESNLVAMPDMNDYMLGDITDYNDDENLKNVYATAVMLFTAMLGDSELERVVQHANKQDFYQKMLQVFNMADQGLFMGDKLAFIALLINHASVCSSFLYTSDFKVILEIIIREMSRLGEIDLDDQIIDHRVRVDEDGEEEEEEEGESSRKKQREDDQQLPPNLFEEYANCVIEIVESDVYREDMAKVFSREILAMLREIIANPDATPHAVDCCELVLKVASYSLED